MATNDKTLGKVVADVIGYKVRIMMVSKNVEMDGRDGKKIRKSFMGDSGKFGVYAGRKKFIKGDFKTKAEAVEHILTNLVKK